MNKIQYGAENLDCGCATVLVYTNQYGEPELYSTEIKFCKQHEKQDNRILELLEQNRQLKERCKRLDEYDKLVDVNADLEEHKTSLLEALKWAKDAIEADMKEGDEYTKGILYQIEQAIAAAEGFTPAEGREGE